MDTSRRKAPATEEGWYALHDFRRIDWDAWRTAPDHQRSQALEEGVSFLTEYGAVEDANEGESIFYTVTGHKADLLILHLRPSLEHLNRAERAFENTAFSTFTERTTSYVSVTEASGYTHDISEGIDAIDDPGMQNYMRQRLYPSIPDAEYICFYPMDKRRDPEYNWYDLPFDERADHMSAHGDIGRSYAGKVSQMITGSIGFDDYEWGVTLFTNNLIDVKHLLYEMRFDPSTSRFAEFGAFYVGRRFRPDELSAVLAGDMIPTDGETTETVATDSTAESHAGPPSGDDAPHEFVNSSEFVSQVTRFGVDITEYDAGFGLLFRSESDAEDLYEDVEGLRGNFNHYDTHQLTTVRADSGETVVISLWENERAANIASGFLGDLPGISGGIGADLSEEIPSNQPSSLSGDQQIRDELADLDIYAGQPHGEDVYAMVLYSTAPTDQLFSSLESLREQFQDNEDHVKSAVYENPDGDRSAVVSIWESESAAEQAFDPLSTLPDIVARAGEESHFGTMGMFYTVRSEHRADFVETFSEVGDLLDSMDGHMDSALLCNYEDENDMFISSQWRDQEAAVEFFRSDAFRETVEWGREILADRPRHVFLA